MKRSDFVKKVLNSKSNTVFVNKDQVTNAIMVFESLGMLPPEDEPNSAYNGDNEPFLCEWGSEYD